MSRSAEDVAAQRERIANRRMEAPDLPDVISCAVVGLSFVPEYPLNVRHLERLLSERYWASPDDPQSVAGLLRRNPVNEYDANACEVHFAAGEVPAAPSLLGHLPREVARRLAPEIDSGTGWSCVLVGVRTHPDNPENPGVDVLLTRQAISVPAPCGVEAVIAESVAAMGWGEVHFELATRDVPVPDAIEDMRAALVVVYIAERTEKMGETS